MFVDQVVDTCNQLVEADQDDQPDHKNDPAFRLMEKAFGEFRFELRDHAGDRHAPGVSDDGDRNDARRPSPAQSSNP